jgi:hypothetical protein
LGSALAQKNKELTERIQIDQFGIGGESGDFKLLAQSRRGLNYKAGRSSPLQPGCSVSEIRPEHQPKDQAVNGAERLPLGRMPPQYVNLMPEDQDLGCQRSR